MSETADPRRLWNLCGILVAIYLIYFWASVVSPQFSKLNTFSFLNTEAFWLYGGLVALGLSLLAGWKASKTWYSATVVVGLTLIFILYAASV